MAYNVLCLRAKKKDYPKKVRVVRKGVSELKKIVGLLQINRLP